MPCHSPTKSAVMVSETSMEPLGFTVTSTSKLWILSSRAAAGSASASTNAAKSNAIARRESLVMGGPFRRISLLLRGSCTETYLGDFALGRSGDLEEFARLEIEHAGDDVGWEF